MSPLLELLASAPPHTWLTGLVAVVLRLGPICLLSPILAGSRVPVTVRLALLLILCASIAPGLVLTLEGPAPDGAGWLALGLHEALIGLTLALVTSVAFWGITVGLGMVDQLWGHGLSGGDGIADGPTSELGNALAVAAFVGVGGHVALVAALGHTFAALPPGSPSELPSLSAILGWLAEIFVVAGAVALPIATALWLAQLGVAFIDRSSPALSSALASLPFRGVIATVVLLGGLHLVIDLALDGTLSSI